MATRKARRLTWQDERVPGAPFRIARHVFRPGATLVEHSHEFCEVFWCESGTGLHRVNGSVKPLNAGDVWFMRARDVHAAEGSAPHGVSFVNVSFQAGELTQLQRLVPRREWP
ncbi:MAG TPA: cupin domain-containing protein, partial [Polyangiaceae bacterium]|nr:cupin domain-containing protein [Polyangiaceae bacterium]